MGQLVTISLLLAAVYEWEQLKHVIRTIAYGILHARRPGDYYAAHLDEAVGTVLVIISIPFGLTYLLISSGPLTERLVFMVLQLLLLTAAGISLVLLTRFAALKRAHASPWVSASLALAGVLTPITRVLASHDPVRNRAIAGLALVLSIAPLTGLILIHLLSYTPRDAVYLPNINMLIAVLVGAITIRIIAEILEKFFHRFVPRTLSVYARVTMGIVLIAIISAGI